MRSDISKWWAAATETVLPNTWTQAGQMPILAALSEQAVREEEGEQQVYPFRSAAQSVQAERRRPLCLHTSGLPKSLGADLWVAATGSSRRGRR